MTKFPDQIDTDVELPRVDNSITENGAALINAIREAIFAIEKTIGENPQGSTASLVNRLAQSINDDGTLKAAALLAAGLVALPITNAQVGASAAIEESKLDLDFSTQTLRDLIGSSNITIGSLQTSLADILYRFGIHINGLGLKHDSFDILLDGASPASTPAAFISLTATEVGTALIEINNNHLAHVSTSKVAAHRASSISVQNNFSTFSATEVQGALEGLDASRSVEMNVHRDDLHANGFIQNASDQDGYSSTLQLLPSTIGTSATASIVAGSILNIIDFSPSVLSNFPVNQGDVVVVYTSAAAGVYVINDVGSRGALGLKPALTNTQVEIVGVFPASGTVQCRVFAKSSLSLLKGNLAPTVHQSDVKTDSLQVSRPNSARVVSLGIQPRFITSAATLVIEAGVGSTLVRTITVSNLHYDRTNAPAAVVTLDTIIERINYVFQNRVDGNAFPAAAYRVGDELQIAHNWTDDFATLRISSSGTGNFFLGFDSFGADVLDVYFRPTMDSYYYVNGKQLSDVALILSATASVVGQVFSFSGVDPLALGVQIGHLIHAKDHAVTAERGTYFITGVTSSTITIQKNAGITAQASIEVEIYHDACPLDELNTSVKDLVVETYLTSAGTLGYNERLQYDDSISNLKIVDVSDNFLAATHTLTASVAGSVFTLTLGTGGRPVTKPTSFIGLLEVPAPSNIEFITVSISAAIGNATSSVQVFEHIDEEEVLEVCSVRLNGLLTASNIVDKRLFGTTGLQELREDIVQAHVETPLRDLRSNGVVNGFDILDGYYFDPTFPVSPVVSGLLLRGGVAYVGGVRCDVPTQSVMFPNTSGTFAVALNSLGNYEIIASSSHSVEQLLDGYGGEYALIALATHDGTNITSSEDIRFFIDRLDQKVELLFDSTNHFIGHFASLEAALFYINNWPTQEKFKLRIVSFNNDALDLSSLTKEATLVIDGQVANITVNSNCKVMAETITSRTRPHVVGAITVGSGCTWLELENLKIRSLNVTATSSTSLSLKNMTIDGVSFANVTVAGAGLKSLSVVDSRFLSGFNSLGFTSGFSSGRVEFNRCYWQAPSGGKMLSIGGEEILFKDCVFDNVGVSCTASGKNLLFSACVFKNMTTTGSVSAIDSVANTVVTGSIFDSITTSGLAAISADYATINNTIFRNCTVGIGDLLLDIDGNVYSSVFEDITFAASAFARCRKFSDNILSGATNSSLVQCERFTGNNGFHAVESTPALKLKSVDGNVFPSNGVFGWSVEGSVVAGDGYGLAITNNTFSTTSIAIDLGILPYNVSISNNVFTGAGTAINFGSSAISDLGIVVSDNIIKTADPFSSAAATGGIVISNNRITCTSGSVTCGNHFQVIGNYWVNTDFTFVTGSATGFRLSDNNFTGDGVINIGSLNQAVISDNYLNGDLGTGFVLEGSYVDTVFSGNVVTIEFGGASTASMVVYTNNIGSFNSLSNMVWKNSIIQNNIILESGSLTFTLFSDPSSNDANVVIRTNLFTDPVTITSTDPLHGFVFSENVSIDSSVPPLTVTFSSSVNEAEITSNFNLSLNFSGGLQASIVSDNILLDGTLTLGSSVSSAIISSNYFKDIDVECTSTGGLVLSNNFVSNNFDILNLTSGSVSVDGAVFSGNYVVGDLRMLSATTSAAANLAITDCLFTSNRFQNLSILSVSNATGASGAHVYTGNKFLQNTVVSNVTIFNTATNLSALTFTDNKFANNDVAGTLDMRMLALSGVTAPSLENISFDNNVLAGEVTWSGEWEADGLYFRSNLLASDFIYNVESQDGYNRAISNVNVLDNISSGSFTMAKVHPAGGAHTITVTNVNFSGNTSPSGVITFSRSESSSNIYNVENLVFSRNICRRIDVLAGGTPGAVAGYLSVNSLFIFGNYFVVDDVIQSGIKLRCAATNSSSGFLTGVLINSNLASGTGSNPAKTEVSTPSTTDHIALGGLVYTSNSYVNLDIANNVGVNEAVIASNFADVSIGAATPTDLYVTSLAVFGNKGSVSLESVTALNGVTIIGNIITVLTIASISSALNGCRDILIADNALESMTFNSTGVTSTESVVFSANTGTDNEITLDNISDVRIVNCSIKSISAVGTLSNFTIAGNTVSLSISLQSDSVDTLNLTGNRVTNNIQIQPDTISALTINGNSCKRCLIGDGDTTTSAQLIISDNIFNSGSILSALSIESETIDTTTISNNTISCSPDAIFGVSFFIDADTISNTKLISNQIAHKANISSQISNLTVSENSFTGSSTDHFNITSPQLITSSSVARNSISCPVNIVATADYISKLNFEQNTCLDDVTITAGTTIDNMSFLDNTIRSGDVIVTCTGTMNDTAVTGNKFPEALTFSTDSTMRGMKFAFNSFSNSSGKIALISADAITNIIWVGNISTSTGAITSGITSATGNISYAVVSQNLLIGDFTIQSGADLSLLNVSENSMTGSVTLQAVATIGGARINNNTLSGALTNSIKFNCAGIANVVVSQNNVDNDLDFQTGYTDSANSVDRLYLHSNIAGRIMLPKLTSFDDDQRESKFYFNHASTWVGNASSPITVEGDNKIFPWGNTATNAATDVSFSEGSPANRTVDNTNNIASNTGIAI